MKTTLVLAAFLACSLPALAGDLSLTTTDGKTYDHISSLRADPDGVYIEYATPKGGLGGAKVKFSRLSPNLQKQYGYNADAAKQYTEDNYKASQAFITWAARQDEAHQKAQSDRDARDLQEDTLATQRAVAAAQAALANQGTPPAQPDYSSGWYYGYGGFGLGPIAPRNTWTGATFKGAVPYDMLFTPLGFSPNKTQSIPATPSRRNISSRPSAARSSSHNFQ